MHSHTSVFKITHFHGPYLSYLNGIEVMRDSKMLTLRSVSAFVQQTVPVWKAIYREKSSIVNLFLYFSMCVYACFNYSRFKIASLVPQRKGRPVKFQMPCSERCLELTHFNDKPERKGSL